MKIAVILFSLIAGFAFQACHTEKDGSALNDKITAELSKNDGIFVVADKDLTTGETPFD